MKREAEGEKQTSRCRWMFSVYEVKAAAKKEKRKHEKERGGRDEKRNF